MCFAAACQPEQERLNTQCEELATCRLSVAVKTSGSVFSPENEYQSDIECPPWLFDGTYNFLDLRADVARCQIPSIVI